jgi:DNA-binding transcriptional LysR family regulator
MLPSSTDLEYFLEVSRTLNISRASERIGISQPTLTQSIRKLESVVGMPLLIRSRTGVRLTRAGQRIALQTGALLEAWNALQREAHLDENELQGKFRIGLHPSVARYTLPQFFKELHSKAPKIEVELFHDLSRHITDAVIGFRIDLGFVINPVAHPDLVLKQIYEDTVSVFEAEKGRYADVLFGDPDLIQTQWILKKLRGSGLKFSKFVPAPNLEVVHRLVASGAGFGILPSLVARCESGKVLKPVDRKLPQFKDQLFLAYRKEVMSSKAAKALIEIGKSISFGET